MRNDCKTKADTLDSLRQAIQKIEGFKADNSGHVASLGIEALDKAFPNLSFPLGAIHELTCDSRTQIAPTLGFASCMVSCVVPKDSPILWITKSRDIFAPGLAAFGIEPHRIVFLTVQKDDEALWAMEEGLRTRGLSAVVAEVTDANITATRRLQIAVENTHCVGFLMRVGNKSISNSSCFTSWRISSLPSQLEDGLPGVGFPRWHVELKKVRNGRPGEWDLEWKAGKLHLLARTESGHIQSQNVRTA